MTTEIPAEHPAGLTDDCLLAACDQHFTRRSGPGGQNRNKVETAVILTHRQSGISAEASEQRTQLDNRRVALFRLRLRLALQWRLPSRPSPSSLWRSRCKSKRISVSAEHRDFPTLIAECLDVLDGCQFNTTLAAEQLELSSSQLVRLLRQFPPALELLNTHRLANGKTPYR